MGSIFSTSIGKKLVMSISGLFLVTFLLVHLTVNLMLLVDDGETFNRAAHFMATNPVIKIVEPLLAFGFVFHILFSGYLYIRNLRARPVGYAVKASDGLSTWASKNMLILGTTILAFLILHIANFFWKMRFGEVPTISYDNGITIMQDAYPLVSGLFIEYWWYDAIYIVAAVLLGLHLSHGFWSAFQTLGWNNQKWIRRLSTIAYIFAAVIASGFTIIPLYFLIFK
jgi:succinate dehydrogenase / fumarate reductase, cytochrome b subunit